MLKKFFKSWQVCDWLANWLIMLGFVDLRHLRVVRRSNVGLVLFFLTHTVEPIIGSFQKVINYANLVFSVMFVRNTLAHNILNYSLRGRVLSFKFKDNSNVTIPFLFRVDILCWGGIS